MLKITTNQMQSIGDISHFAFIEKLVDFFISLYHPELTPTASQATKDALRQRIVVNLDKAESYDLVTEKEQFEYLLCAFELGDDFDRNPDYPWAAAILNDREGKDHGQRLSTALDLQLKVLG